VRYARYGRIDDGRAVLSSADMALLVYADKLTHSPGAMTAADVERLREAGFGDRAIHDACAIVAYFAFVNRIADGLGVELESPLAQRTHAAPNRGGERHKSESRRWRYAYRPIVLKKVVCFCQWTAP